MCFPAPLGAYQDPPSHVSTNCRNRPTVTSYLSSRNPLIVVDWYPASPAIPGTIRLNVPPGTSRLVQQLSPPSGPQSVIPAPPGKQLTAAAVEPPQAPVSQVPVAHVHG